MEIQRGKNINRLLSSGLYRRLRNLTGSAQSARGLYRRWGISPRPEDLIALQL